MKIMTVMPNATEFEGLLGPVSEPAVSSISAESRGLMDALGSDLSDDDDKKDELKEKSKIDLSQSKGKMQKDVKVTKKGTVFSKKPHNIDQDSATMEIEPTPRISDQDNLDTENFFNKKSRSPKDQDKLRQKGPTPVSGDNILIKSREGQRIARRKTDNLKDGDDKIMVDDNTNQDSEFGPTPNAMTRENESRYGPRAEKFPASKNP